MRYVRRTGTEWISFIEYDIVKPSGTPQCLIFSVHGAFQGGINHEATLRMNPAGTAKQCIVVTPTNMLTRYAIWPLLMNEYANNAMYKMVRSFQTLYEIASNKTYFTGFSQGAWMTWWMWLNYPQSFGGFVAISGSINGLIRCLEMVVQFPNVQSKSRVVVILAQPLLHPSGLSGAWWTVFCGIWWTRRFG